MKRSFPKKHLSVFGLAALFCLSFFAGQAAARFTANRPASSPFIQNAADGNWGLSFQTKGQTPVGNATSDYLKQYRACYAGSPDEKVIYLTFDAGYENGNTAPILDALKKHQAPKPVPADNRTDHAQILPSSPGEIQRIQFRNGKRDGLYHIFLESGLCGLVSG